MSASNMVTASRTTACNQDTNRATELHRIVTQDHSQAMEDILLLVTVATTGSTLTAAVEATIVEVAILQVSKCINNNMRHSTRRSTGIQWLTLWVADNRLATGITLDKTWEVEPMTQAQDTLAAAVMLAEQVTVPTK